MQNENKKHTADVHYQAMNLLLSQQHEIHSDAHITAIQEKELPTCQNRQEVLLSQQMLMSKIANNQDLIDLGLIHRTQGHPEATNPSN